MNTFENDQIESIDDVMKNMPIEWRYRWCEPELFGCACMGAANCSGRLGGKFSKAQWQDWVQRNPQEKIQQISKNDTANISLLIKKTFTSTKI